jgi:hypothetical protein
VSTTNGEQLRNTNLSDPYPLKKVVSLQGQKTLSTLILQTKNS